MNLKDDYVLAGCCSPQPGDAIVGYYSHTNILKVHRRDCGNLAKADAERLVTLQWADILAGETFRPDDDYTDLTALDFRILEHHRLYGNDYSLKVAGMLSVEKQDVFDCHTRLRKQGLLQRVEPLMIRYRKNIVKGKWIKHRNHTYYELTAKGRKYLEYHGRTTDG